MKKPANTRAGNQRKKQRLHVLDVTLSQSKERAKRRWRIFSLVTRCILAVALVVGVVVGSREALRRFVWENPDYALAEIQYRTDGTLLREDALTAAGLVEGVNIFKVDLAQARDAIAALPQVERVELQRLLPNCVTVAIIERKPIAWVMKRGDEDPTLSTKAFLIDGRAIPMKPRSTLQQYIHLPIIYGFPVENLADGQRVKNYEIQAALELIRLNADNTRWQIQKIDVASGYSLVVTDSRRIELTFHLDHFDRQLERLHKLFTLIGPERQKELKTVNLFGERNTYVTFHPPPEPEAEATASAMIPVSNTSRAPVKSTTGKSGSSAKSTPAPKSNATPAPARKTSPAIRLKNPFNPNGQR